MSKFDDIIQQKANEHQAPVPAGAWDNIIKEKKKRRFIFFWWMFGILLCGLTITGSYLYNNSGSNKIASKQKGSTAANTNISTGDKATIPQTQPVIAAEKSNIPTGTGNTPAQVNKSTANEPGNNDIKDTPGAGKKIMTGDKAINSKTNVAVKHEQNNKKNPGNKYAANSNKPQIAPAASSQHVQQKSTVKKQESNESWAKNRKKTIKEKGNSKINIQPGETETLTEHKDEVKNNNNIAVAETKEATSKEMNDEIRATELSVIVAGSKNIPPTTSAAKKDLVVDSVQTKQAITTPVENKKAQAVVNKPAKKHSWFIDLGIAPVFPIEQYDQSTTFSRTHLSNNNLSVFSGKLVSTNIDPSVAFSLSVRRSMNKKLSIGLGLQFLQLKEQVIITGTETNTKYTIVDRLVNNINGPQLVSDTVETITEGERKISAVNSYTFFSIPVFVQYDFIQNKSWSLGVIGGAYVNVYGKYKNEINEHNDADLVASTPANSGNSSVGISLYGGIRLGKQIAKRIELFAAPSITWGLGTQNIKNSLLNKKIQQAGLNIGLSYKLN